MAQWSTILAEMNLAKDPKLKDVVQSLRALNLYDNESWNSLVIVGYTYWAPARVHKSFGLNWHAAVPIPTGRSRRPYNNGSRSTSRAIPPKRVSSNGELRAQRF
jgi:hypothetical protein